MAISDLAATDAQQRSAPTAQPIARLTDVGLVFRDGIRALDHFNLTVLPGDCMGVLGPNGAGKTSLLRLLAGLAQPSAGQIELFGMPARHQGIVARRRIGYVSQQSGIDQYLTGQGNLLLAGRLHGQSGGDLHKRTELLLDLVGLRNHARRQAAQYSGGMRRRLALACSLIHQPDLLLLDEPTTGLDTSGKAALWKHLLMLQQAGLTIIATSHDTQEIERYCSRVALIDRGRLVMEGTPAALKAQIQGDLLTLAFSEAPQASKALALLQHESYIRSAMPGEAETQVYLEAPDGPAAIPQITRLLEASGVVLRRLTLSRPTLEDVFFRATGTPLSDSERPSVAPTEVLAQKSRHRSPFRRRSQQEVQS
ncbi:MAG TPA: ABC transporter ATP-binding protein [Ktedonobacterales bacterium]|nr:ABC transporter ATP-binding protein [Ktedonobacterales bacterium]